MVTLVQVPDIVNYGSKIYKQLHSSETILIKGDRDYDSYGDYVDTYVVEYSGKSFRCSEKEEAIWLAETIAKQEGIDSIFVH